MLGVDLFYAATRGVVSSIKWLLTNVLNLTATVGPDAVDGYDGIPRFPRIWTPSGLELPSGGIAGATPLSEGMRWTGSEFVNNDGSGNSLTPTKQLTENGVTSTVFIVYQPWADSVVVPAGGVLTDFDGVQCKYYSSVNGGTTSGTGVADDTGVTDWIEQGNYNNIQKNENGDGWLTHVMSEDVAVNLALQSQDFSTTWSTSNATVSTDATTSPDGTTTADKFVEGSGTTFRRIRQNINFISGTIYTFSVYGKTSERTGLNLTLNTGAFPTSAIGLFDLTGASPPTALGGLISAEMTSAGDGWYRCSITALADATVLSTTEINMTETQGSSPDYLGDSSSGLFLWQADVVAASTVSTPIPTTTGTVQRNATSFLVTPEPAEFLRLRFADVFSQTYLSSGTIEVSYDVATTTLTWTDGTNAMTHVVAMKPGDFATVEEATGKLYYNGSLVDTNGSYSPTWGEIALGNAVDYIFDADLDPTDTTWSQP
jgi:hypothetical protein